MPPPCGEGHPDEIHKPPVCDNALCIGCGICDNKCPVVDEPAIYVTSVGEVRSNTNQLLLPLIGTEPPQL